ncbi:hypothetical protein HDU93_006442, partial [Gonapodya sp. JEL0774]
SSEELTPVHSPNITKPHHKQHKEDVRGPVIGGTETPSTSSLVFPNPPRGRSSSVKSPSVIAEPAHPASTTIKRTMPVLAGHVVPGVERNGTERSQTAEVEAVSSRSESEASEDEDETRDQGKASRSSGSVMGKKEVDKEFDELFRELEMLKI